MLSEGRCGVDNLFSLNSGGYTSISFIGRARQTFLSLTSMTRNITA